MNNIGRVLMYFGIFFLGLSMGSLVKRTKPVNVTTITKTDTTLVNQVKVLKEQNETLLDELQFKESESSYWGRKYEEEKNKK